MADSVAQAARRAKVDSVEQMGRLHYKLHSKGHHVKQEVLERWAGGLAVVGGREAGGVGWGLLA